MKKIIIGLCLIPFCFIGQTPGEVLKELKKQNVLFPEIVLAQSILETGWYKCDRCSMDNNNLFGLWNSSKKEYFNYNTWQESVGGYKRGIQYKYYRKEYKSYYEFLTDIGYAEDPKYISKLKQIASKF